jgi:glycosyltransferase involved in cell wall biosynthesis
LKFSLIVATVDRTDEIRGLLDSLSKQVYKNFEVIVIDQNKDDRLKPVLDNYQKNIEIIHLRSEKGLSRARNVGLSTAHGEIVAFPDDDCTYPVDLLARIADWMKKNTSYAGLSGRSVDKSGNESVGQFDQRAGEINEFNIWRRMTSIGLFVRIDILGNDCRFDETLGVGAGTEWGAAEDIDFPLQLMAKGARLYYDPSIEIIHPGVTPMYDKNAFIRGRNYGGGMARVVKKHNYPLGFKMKILIRPLGGVVLSAIMGRLGKARFHWNVLGGRFKGLFE